jgi:hypothetical protein
VPEEDRQLSLEQDRELVASALASMSIADIRQMVWEMEAELQKPPRLKLIK